jgi:hypothetical protein
MGVAGVVAVATNSVELGWSYCGEGVDWALSKKSED